MGLEKCFPNMSCDSRHSDKNRLQMWQEEFRLVVGKNFIL